MSKNCENQWKQRHSSDIQTLWLTANWNCQNKCQFDMGFHWLAALWILEGQLYFVSLCCITQTEWRIIVVNFRWDPSHSLRPASRSYCHNPGLHTFISDISSQCRIACSELYKVRQRRGSLEAPPTANYTACPLAAGGAKGEGEGQHVTIPSIGRL